jgi:hypothetical protein
MLAAIRRQAHHVFVAPRKRTEAFSLLRCHYQVLFTGLMSDLSEVQAKMVLDPLSALVSFFNIVSPWHDRGIDDLRNAFVAIGGDEHKEILQKIEALQKHFRNAGRDKSGMNRTDPGEMVAPDKVFLGGIHGLFTRSIPEWEKGKNEPKGGWGHYDPNGYFAARNSYDVVSDKARQFMTSHIGPMKEILSSLIRTSLSGS